MPQRRFGPTRGAGTVIIEKEGQKTIEPAALGWAGYAGILEKGPPNELIEAQSQAWFEKVCGSYISDSELPDNCIDYYKIANGAGGLLLVRVTDGTEVKSEFTMYARYGDLLTPMGTLKAHNGGRWGGKRKRYTGDMSVIGDLTETTLDTGVTMIEDQWAGGVIELSDVANTQYPIISNTTAGVITVAADQTMLADHSGGADLRYYLVLDNETKYVSAVIGDGEENPDTEFSLEIFVNGDSIKKYGNLSTDPVSSRYWVNLINNDDSNYEVEATDLWTGAHTAAVRPANHYGKIDAVTTTTLTAEIHDFTINSPGGGDPTFALGVTRPTDDNMLPQKITITMTAPTTGTAVSDLFGALGTVTLGTEFDPEGSGSSVIKWCPSFTVTAGASPLAATDTLVINYKPFIADALIDGFVYPDKPNAKLTKFRITDNTHKIITVATGSDLTVDGAIDDYFLIEYNQQMAGGVDGNAGLVDADYNQQAWDVGSSPFNQIVGKNRGMIKFATPGYTATAVQKAGIAYAAAKNHQYREEIPSNITTENGAITQVNDTIGRSDFAVVSFPSFGWVTDPEATQDGKRKLTSMTG
jgi:hypothetical protein